MAIGAIRLAGTIFKALARTGGRGLKYGAAGAVGGGIGLGVNPLLGLAAGNAIRNMKMPGFGGGGITGAMAAGGAAASRDTTITAGEKAHSEAKGPSLPTLSKNADFQKSIQWLAKASHLNYKLALKNNAEIIHLQKMFQGVGAARAKELRMESAGRRAVPYIYAPTIVQGGGGGGGMLPMAGLGMAAAAIAGLMGAALGQEWGVRVRTTTKVPTARPGDPKALDEKGRYMDREDRKRAKAAADKAELDRLRNEERLRKAGLDPLRDKARLMEIVDSALRKQADLMKKAAKAEGVRIQKTINRMGGPKWTGVSPETMRLRAELAKIALDNYNKKINRIYEEWVRQEKAAGAKGTAEFEAKAEAEANRLRAEAAAKEELSRKLQQFRNAEARSMEGLKSYETAQKLAQQRVRTEARINVEALRWMKYGWKPAGTTAVGAQIFKGGTTMDAMAEEGLWRDPVKEAKAPAKVVDPLRGLKAEIRASNQLGRRILGSLDAASGYRKVMSLGLSNLTGALRIGLSEIGRGARVNIDVLQEKLGKIQRAFTRSATPKITGGIGAHSPIEGKSGVNFDKWRSSFRASLQNTPGYGEGRAKVQTYRATETITAQRFIEMFGEGSGTKTDGLLKGQRLAQRFIDMAETGKRIKVPKIDPGQRYQTERPTADMRQGTAQNAQEAKAVAMTKKIVSQLPPKMRGLPYSLARGATLAKTEMSPGLNKSVNFAFLIAIFCAYAVIAANYFYGKYDPDPKINEAKARDAAIGMTAILGVAIITWVGVGAVINLLLTTIAMAVGAAIPGPGWAISLGIFLGKFYLTDVIISKLIHWIPKDMKVPGTGKLIHDYLPDDHTPINYWEGLKALAMEGKLMRWVTGEDSRQKLAENYGYKNYGEYHDAAMGRKAYAQAKREEAAQIVPGASLSVSGAYQALGKTIMGGESSLKGYNDYYATESQQAALSNSGIYNYGNLDFSKLSIDRIRSMQKQGLFGAVGKYQITGGTLDYLMQYGPLKGSQKFTPKLQEELYRWILLKKRPQMLGSYLKGTGSTLEDAQIAMSKEWASIALPRDVDIYKDGVYVRTAKKGGSYYENQKATIKASDIALLLQQLQLAIMAQAKQDSAAVTNGAGNNATAMFIEGDTTSVQNITRWDAADLFGLSTTSAMGSYA